MQEVLQCAGASLGGTMLLEVTLLKDVQTDFLSQLPEPNPPKELSTTDWEEALLPLEFSDRRILVPSKQTRVFHRHVDLKHSADPQETERCAVVQLDMKVTHTQAVQQTPAHNHLVGLMLCAKGMVESP